MKYELYYTKKSWTDLQSIGQTEARKIVIKLKSLAAQANPLINSKPLKGIFKGLFRFRIGNYRAIFKKDAQGNLTILTIITIRHRKDVYD